jgi:hypothetical protein
MASRVLVLWAVLGMGLTACGQSDSGTAGVETVRTVVGDTTIVRTLGGGVWGDSVRLVEEVAIGALDGAEEYLFGRVGDLAVDADGGIYVFDGQVPALRYYDSNGELRADARWKRRRPRRVQGCLPRRRRAPE